MAYKPYSICRKCSLIAGLLLMLQSVSAQQNFDKVDNWLNDNINSLGGRTVLIIYKDGKIIYSHAENKMVAK